MELTIETTSDGSPTLYRKDIDEHYHSMKGALAESQHVYVELGWCKAAKSREQVNLFEVGFGTGLNAALTAKAAEESRHHTFYTAIELYPLSKIILEKVLCNTPDEYRELLTKVNEADWNKPVELTPYFTIHKIEGDLMSAKIPEWQDVVYYDAFAPEKQPQMWDSAIFEKLFVALSPGGCLTTYCAKGVIRRMLNSIGFVTERLPGPPGGKREVLRAIKPDL